MNIFLSLYSCLWYSLAYSKDDLYTPGKFFLNNLLQNPNKYNTSSGSNTSIQWGTILN